MYAVDFNNQLNNYLLDEKRKISKAHLDAVCQIEQKEKTCRYIALSKIGYVCMKKSPAKAKLDQLVKENNLIAQSDNCEGLGNNFDDNQK
jgi:hypothetical protein